MNTLCIDPGLVAWAWALFDENDELVLSETIYYKSKGNSQEKRMDDIYKTLMVVNQDYGPIGKIVTERQFVDIMQQLTGVIRCWSGSIDITTELFTPPSWRKYLTGKGNAKEDVVKKAVLEKYPVLEEASEHEIDCAALYIASKKKNELS